jgi:hypothetical protein
LSRASEGCRRRIYGWRNPMAGGACLVSALVICAPGAFPEDGAGPLQRIVRTELCVTNGAVSALQDRRLAIDTPSSRAIVRNATGKTEDQAAEIRFRYLGPSQADKPLASGELRRQIGLKLQAQDTCNLVYAMWHIEPDTRIAVSVKRNIGMQTHAQCGAGGYQFLKAQSGIDPPPIRPGEAHTLRAELHGSALTVTTDGKVSWQGTLESNLPPGPMGFRTDNARFVLEYYADGAASRLKARPGPARCVMSAGD